MLEPLEADHDVEARHDVMREEFDGIGELEA